MANAHSIENRSWIYGIAGLLFIASLVWMTSGNLQSGANAWQAAVSALLLSIPLGLFFFSLGLLADAILQKRGPGRFHPRLAAALYRTPRIAGVLIIFFISLFSLDVFSEGQPFLAMLGALFMHLLPAIVLAVLLALAWRREWIGSLAFLAASLYFLRYAAGDWRNGFGIVLLFSGPLLSVALLFWANWQWRAELRSR